MARLLFMPLELQVIFLINDIPIESYIRIQRVAVGSSGGVVVKLLACGARGAGFNSWSRSYDFRDWLSPASKSR